MLPEYIHIKCTCKGKDKHCPTCKGTGEQAVHLGRTSVNTDLAEAMAYIEQQSLIESKRKGKKK